VAGRSHAVALVQAPFLGFREQAEWASTS
jgi:hypothetical protein